MNEIGHGFPGSESPAHIPTWQMRSRDFVHESSHVKCKANQMMGLRIQNTA